MFSLVSGSIDLTKYFRTNIVSGDPLIFSVNAGVYTFSIDNRSSSPSKPARWYDLAFVAADISALQLPSCVVARTHWHKPSGLADMIRKEPVRPALFYMQFQ